MNITAVIAEYNPFHNGHAWQLAKAKELTNADFLIVLMSGDYVQRGAPAILDQHTRAQMALLGGADLVLQLPCWYSLGSAQYFARGAVSLLQSLGCVHALCFGSECGSIEPFYEIAQILVKEPPLFSESLTSLLRKGLPYPAARNQALRQYLLAGPDSSFSLSEEQLDAFLMAPNNILGLEYVQALLLNQSTIVPVTVPRTGNGYHDPDLSETSFSSASAVRNAIRSRTSSDLLPKVMPETAFSILQSALLEKGAVFEDDFGLLLAARLLNESRSSLGQYLDLSDDLANRIFRNRFSCTSFREFTALLKTKELTYTRISRALMHILLDIREPFPPAWQRILGFRKEARPLLTHISSTCSLPLITSPAKASSLLSDKAFSAFEQDISASLLYETVRSHKTKTAFVHEYQKQLILL